MNKICILPLSKYLGVSFILMSALMSSSGVDLKSSLLLSLAIIAQWIPGASLWIWVSRERRTTTVEILGMGLAMGTLLALLFSQFFLVSPLGRFGWAIPFLLSIPWLAWQSFRGTNFKMRMTQEIIAQRNIKNFIPAIIFGLVELSVWWRWHPLKWSGWWKFNVDVPYFESYSNSLALLGTTHSLMDPTLNTRYHWFSYAWVGSLSNSFDIDPFVALTRLLPIISITMAATIAYAWANSMSQKNWIPGLAALIVVIGPGLSIGSFVMLRSPSSAMSAGWSLAFSFLLFEIIKGEAKQIVAYLILILLAIGLVGGKATNTVLVSFAILALLFASITQRTKIRNRIWVPSIISLIFLAVTFKLLISSPEARHLDFGLFLGWPGLFLTILPTSIGIYGLYIGKLSIREPFFVYSFGTFLAGSLLSLFTYDPSGNQIYFLLSAATILVVPSLIGLEKIIYSEKQSNLLSLINRSSKQSKFYLAIMVLVAGVSTTFVWTFFENSTSITGKFGRTLAPLLLWTICIMVSLTLLKVFSSEVKVRRNPFDLIFITLLTATLIASGSSILSSVFHGPIYAGSAGVNASGKSTKNVPGSISYNYVLAGEWIQKHTQPEEIFFSNRQCIDIKSALNNCDGLWSYASAFSKRQFIIEGAAYSTPSKARGLTRQVDQQLSIRFSLNPNEKDWQSLLAQNVRWGWIDRKVSKRTDWGKFAQVIFSNSDVAVIKLLEPTS